MHKKGCLTLKEIIAQKLDENDIKFEHFYYSFCKKKPRELTFSKVDDWINVDVSLQKIFKEQLVYILNSQLNDKNFEGISTGTLLEINREIKLPEGIEFPKDEKVLDIFDKVIRDGLTKEELQILGDTLALKYLTARYSRPSIYGLLTFQVEIEDEMRRFAFVTLCDLHLRHQNLRVDEDARKLVAEIIKNVFSKRELTKGVLYPYLESELVYGPSLLLYEDDKSRTLHWAEAFECQKRLSKRDEKEAVDGLIKEYFTKSEGLHLEEVGSFFKEIAATKEAAFSSDACGKALKQVHQSIDAKQVKKNWNEKLKLEERNLSMESIWSDKRDYTIQMGEKVELKVTPKKLKNIKQFVHHGRPYLVIEGDEAAKMGNIQLASLTWGQFKKAIEEE